MSQKKWFFFYLEPPMLPGIAPESFVVGIANSLTNEQAKMVVDLIKRYQVESEAFEDSPVFMRPADELPPEDQLYHETMLPRRVDGNSAYARYRDLTRSAIAAVAKSMPTADSLPPLTDTERAVYELIDGQPPGEGILGKQIIAELQRLQPPIDIGQSTLTRHIIPSLRKHYDIPNRPSVGYYTQST